MEESRTWLVRYRSGERREEHMPLRLGQLAAQLEAQIEHIPSRGGIDGIGPLFECMKLRCGSVMTL